MAVPVWNTFSTISTLGTPVIELLRYLMDTQQIGGTQEERKAGLGEILAGLGDFGAGLDKYLQQTAGANLQALGALGRSNVRNAYDRAGAIIRGWEPNWSGRAADIDYTALARSLLPPQQAQGGQQGVQQGVQQGEQSPSIDELRKGRFDPKWLNEKDRREYDRVRWWQGPNSLAGKYKGNEQAFNEWAWRRFGNKDYVIQKLTQAASGQGGREQQGGQQVLQQGAARDYIGPLTGRNYGPRADPQAVIRSEFQSLGLAYDDSRSPEENLAGFIRSTAESSERFNRNITEGIPSAFKGYEGQYNEVMRLLEGMGEQAKKDVRGQFYKLGQTDTANLAARGLSGTTVGSAMDIARGRTEADAIAAIEEQVRQEKASASERISDKAINALNQILSGMDASSLGLGIQATELADASARNRINNAWDLANAIMSVKMAGLPPQQQMPLAGDYLAQGFSGAMSSWGQARAARDAIEAQNKARRSALVGSIIGAGSSIGGAALGGWMGGAALGQALGGAGAASAGGSLAGTFGPGMMMPSQGMNLYQNLNGVRFGW